MRQMSSKFWDIFVLFFKREIKDKIEVSVVRYECVLTLGKITDRKAVFEKYATDIDNIVRESALVV